MLVYYQVTESHYSRLARMDMSVLVGPVLAERVLGELGLAGRLRYKLRPTGDWHRFEVGSRTVELSGPTCTVLEVLHELAHWWEPGHNGRHLMALQLLVEAWGQL
jgi:hypothetical protein